MDFVNNNEKSEDIKAHNSRQFQSHIISTCKVDLRNKMLGTTRKNHTKSNMPLTPPPTPKKRKARVKNTNKSNKKAKPATPSPASKSKEKFPAERYRVNWTAPPATLYCAEFQQAPFLTTDINAADSDQSTPKSLPHVDAAVSRHFDIRRTATGASTSPYAHGHVRPKSRFVAIRMTRKAAEEEMKRVGVVPTRGIESISVATRKEAARKIEGLFIGLPKKSQKGSWVVSD